jgi:hypothetical protein
VKKLNPKKLLFGALLVLMVFSGVGCVVADRPYYNEPYRRDGYVRPYSPNYPYRYYRYRDHYRWHRDRDRWDRD